MIVILPSTVAIIILIITLILFATEKIPLPVTAILAMLAMAFSGILPYNEAFSGFCNRVTLMIIGMSIVSSALTATGISSKIGNILSGFERFGEKTFLLVVFAASIVLSGFINAMIVVVMLTTVIDTIAARPDSTIKRKSLYLPIAIGGVIGGNITCIAASCMLTASGILEDSYYGSGMSTFEPLKISLLGIIVCIVFYATVGYKLQNKWLDFKENEFELPAKSKASESSKLSWRAYFALFVLIACIIAFVCGINMGAVALTGACLVMLSGCISCKDAFKGVGWETVFTVAASLGFARGIEASGAGEVIANALFSMFGSFGQSAYFMCVLVLFLSTLLSNFMSNTAAVTIVLPISLVISNSLGANPVAFALASGLGAEISLATPICTAAITYTVGVGYRNKDYLRIGGLLNVLLFITDAIMFKLVFFI